MTEGGSANSEPRASGGQPRDTASGQSPDRPQHTAPSSVQGSPTRRSEAQVLPAKRTLYERLTHDMQHDHKVNKEVRMGKRVGFYKLKGQLGTGNFAKVKLGVHLLTTEKVAVKIIDKTKLDEDSRRLLSREIVCMEWLDHPNIIRLYEVMESFSTLHLVMECAGEGDVQARIIKEGPLNEDQARHIFAQVTAAINHMHKKGVIHRDLKAENVFYVSESQIKVGDFGFSTQSNSSLLNTFCGSPPYAAPELFADKSYQGELVDIWAMGVMLYYMLSGTMPFRGETIPQLKAKIQAGKFDMPGGLTPVCQELITGLLTLKTEERFVMEDVFSSMWLRTNSTAMELNPSKKNLGRKTNSKSHLPKLTRDHGVVDSSGPEVSGEGSRSALEVSFDSGSDSTPDREVLQRMEMIGVPTCDDNVLVGEPRNPIAGTYRILLHRKHLSELAGHQEERTAESTQDRNKKISSCSLAEGQTASGNGASVNKRKISKGSGGIAIGKPMSKICAIL